MGSGSAGGGSAGRTAPAWSRDGLDVRIEDTSGEGTGPWKLFLGGFGVARWPSRPSEEDPKGYAESVAEVVRKALAGKVITWLPEGRIFDILSKHGDRLPLFADDLRDHADAVINPALRDDSHAAADALDVFPAAMAVIQMLLASARPNVREHPTMFAAWQKAAAFLGGDQATLLWHARIAKLERRLVDASIAESEAKDAWVEAWQDDSAAPDRKASLREARDQARAALDDVVRELRAARTEGP